MKRFLVLAALLMAAPSAHAGNSISFQIEGHKIRIEAPKNCSSLSCIQISAPSLSDSTISGSSLGSFKGFTSNGSDDDADVAEDSSAPKAAPGPAPAQATAPQPAAPVASSAPIASPAPAAPTAVATASPTPSAEFDTPAPAAAPAAATPPATVAPPPAAAPAPAPTTPLGVWATEKNKGNVRIEQCGDRLCGYAEKTGEKILINMKPSKSKWTGKIHDPDSGRKYDSTIAMKGPNSLRVQGCAFGGMFCGGQTWKRVS